MLLKSDKGMYVSNARLEGAGDDTSAEFELWRPECSNAQGKLYLPLDLNKIAPLDIMLKEVT